jgi:transcriptional regulator with XRE-family HTH domain
LQLDGVSCIALPDGAAEIGVELRSVSAYETGEFNPEPDRLTVIARTLRFPQDFFFGDDIEEPAIDTASFRSLSKMTARQRDTALGSGAVAMLLNEWIETRFDLPTPELPDLGRDASPESAAAAVRQAWGLGELPIKNMVHLLESKGARVYSLAIDAVEVDAFSMWRRNRPFVFLILSNQLNMAGSTLRTNWATSFYIVMPRLTDRRRSRMPTPLRRRC